MAAVSGGLAVGCLFYFVDQFAGLALPGVVLFVVLIVVVVVPPTMVILGLAGALARWRDPAARVRAIATLLFGLAWIVSYYGLSQLHLRGII